jgi:hypothetical protein
VKSVLKSVLERTPVANSDEQLRSVLATLEGCQAVLMKSTSRETAQLVSVAILQLRMKLNQVAESELKALCDAMIPAVRPVERSPHPKMPSGRRPPGSAMLKLVK